VYIEYESFADAEKGDAAVAVAVMRAAGIRFRKSLLCCPSRSDLVACILVVVIVAVVFPEILGCVPNAAKAAVLAVQMDKRMMDWIFIVGFE